MTLQEIIHALNAYWSERGCIIQQPYDIEVGAGTFNPATSLRCLGPEPYRVAYVEPSRRPTDGRYGENPYKIGHYYQYQVILKPSPADSQELYLHSLETLGLDLRKNDIRFVEDDWESPTLGASGLGWEVWCNGAEVTQYTYFQQMGSIDLDPICTELTYGLERIAMYLQDVESIFDVQWNEHVKYRDVHHQTEVEYTTYYLEKSSTELLLRWFEDCEAECRHCVENGLPWPALDYVLKASHTFNMLDARGAISVSERVGYIARVRNLSRLVARAYLTSREEQEFPLTNVFPVAHVSAQEPARAAAEPTSESADFLFEIGTEEIPASYVEPALGQMRSRIEAWLGQERLEHGSITTWATPRRLTLHVANVATRQEDLEAEVAGPPKTAAYDADGNPTKAALGFARGQGVTADDLYVKETERGLYVHARKTVPGRLTGDLLASFLPQLVGELRFPKSMRFDGLRFARPIRWLVAMLGDRVVDFPLDLLRSGKTTRGHRFLGASEIAVDSADLDAYRAALRESRVIADHEERRRLIREGVESVLQASGARVEVDEGLLDEVLYLVENVELVTGTFSEDHLRVPTEVLVTAMKKDQRYFPVYNEDGTLQPMFIAISNGTDGDQQAVRHGNERVLKARLENAAFFWDEDRKTPFGDRVEDLKRVTFQVQLGSLHDKVVRVRHLVGALCDELGLDADDRRRAERAAELCKADLTTHMVSEFAELQGVMGRYYALEVGEDGAVAQAVEEHYMPLAGDSDLPSSTIGALLSIADKMDTIVGYFGIGKTPTGSQDPYSLRRQAIGICRILLDRKLPISLSRLIDRAAAGFDASSPSAALHDFFRARLDVMLQERGWAYDVVDAVLAAGFDRPCDLPARLDAMKQFRESPKFEEAYPAFNRLLRIIPEGEFGDVDESLLRDQAEIDLWSSVKSLKRELDTCLRRSDFRGIVTITPFLQPRIDKFFDDVLVMDKDAAVKNNRLALLSQIARYLLAVGDFAKLVIAGDNTST